MKSSLAAAVLMLAVASIGCKRTVELSAPDAGSIGNEPATTAAVAPEATAPAESAAAVAADFDAALPPLDDPNLPKPAVATTTTGKTASAATGTAKPKPAASGAASTPKPVAGGAVPPECAKAKQYCSHPAAATDARIKARCESEKSACLAKGGSVN